MTPDIMVTHGTVTAT